MHECPHAHIPSHSPTPSHLPRQSVKYQPSFCSTNDPYPKQELLFSFLFFKFVTHWKNLQCTLIWSNCVCLCIRGPRIFRVFTAGRRAPFHIFTNLHRRDSYLTVNNIWVFHPRGGGGIYPILLCPITLIFISISFKTV